MLNNRRNFNECNSSSKRQNETANNSRKKKKTVVNDALPKINRFICLPCQHKVNHPKNKFYFPILPFGCQECRYHKFSVRATKAKKSRNFIDLRTKMRKKRKKFFHKMNVIFRVFFVCVSGAIFHWVCHCWIIITTLVQFLAAFVVTVQPIYENSWRLKCQHQIQFQSMHTFPKKFNQPIILLLASNIFDIFLPFQRKWTK